mmetsp:Transcript_16790/g.33941  ORF Transcript_16790/g.33941 Transcript_16790/m.33941 type:complete len:246 (-) Transcript_16790:636-1373(-)
MRFWICSCISCLQVIQLAAHLLLSLFSWTDLIWISLGGLLCFALPCLVVNGLTLMVVRCYERFRWFYCFISSARKQQQQHHRRWRHRPYEHRYHFFLNRRVVRPRPPSRLRLPLLLVLPLLQAVMPLVTSCPPASGETAHASLSSGHAAMPGLVRGALCSSSCRLPSKTYGGRSRPSERHSPTPRPPLATTPAQEGRTLRYPLACPLSGTTRGRSVRLQPLRTLTQELHPREPRRYTVVSVPPQP